MPAAAQPWRYPRVLSIAGSDSGGGAGVQADLKTLCALGCYGMTAITALTAQNTLGVHAVHAVPPPVLRAQIDAVVQDLGADAVKVGMLHSEALVQTVAEALARHRLAPVVLDPVLVSSSGTALLEPAALQCLVQTLVPRVTLLTPNLDEAALLVGRPLRTPADMEAAAQTLLARGAPAVLIKGGHLPGDTVMDLLARPGAPLRWWREARIASGNRHGTGCTLSAAIAGYLALGHALEPAVDAARQFVRGALQAGASVRTGRGDGPLNHGYDPRPMVLLPAAPDPLARPHTGG